MLTTALLLVLAPLCAALPQPSYPETLFVEYTTDGDVKLTLLNLTTWRTTQLHVTLLGCDFGYYDQYLISPPLVTTWQTKVTPFHCIECDCQNFEFPRSEPFVVVEA